MNIIKDLLQSSKYDLRLVSRERWMYFVPSEQVWIVREYSKDRPKLIETINMNDALDVLLGKLP